MAQPWKLRVDWTLHKYEGDPVEVELHRLAEDWTDAPVLVLRKFPSVPRAIDWALKYMADRGCGFWCDIDMHQRLDHTHIMLHPLPVTDRK